jgi:hypothetical protein
MNKINIDVFKNEIEMMFILPITSVSAVGLVSAFCLNLPIQTAGLFGLA